MAFGNRGGGFTILTSKFFMIVTKALILSIINYMVAYALSTGEVLLDLKNFSFIFMISAVWCYIFQQSADKTGAYKIYVVGMFLAFSVPVLGKFTTPFFMQRMMKDVLFYYALIPTLGILIFMGSNQCTRLIKTLLGFVALLPVMVLYGYNCFVGGLLSENTIVSILKTNFQESKEFVFAYLGVTGIASIVVGMLIVLAFVYFLAGQLQKLKLETTVSRKISVVLSLILVVSCYGWGSKGYFTRTLVDAVALKKYMDRFSNSAEQRLKIINKYDHVNLHKKNNNSYALVIGETHNRSHMQAYGYGRQTTPYLSKAVNDGRILLAQNGYACAALTHVVMNMAITEKNQYNNLELNQATNIVEMAKHAGYKVVWISNQMKDSLAGVVAEEADTVLWVNKNTNDTYLRQKVNVFDINTVEALEKLPISNQKTLYVVHLLGSHSRYNCRYPDEFNKWDDKGSYTNSVNSYDNSILYNDFVMEKIRQVMFTKLNVSALVYFSDHGEDGDINFRHGDDFFFKNYKNKGANIKDIVKIPFYIAVSDSYKKQEKAKVDQLKFNLAKPFTNDMIYDTMLGLMNIKCQRYDEQNDFSSYTYKHDYGDLKTISGKVDLQECQ